MRIPPSAHANRKISPQPPTDIDVREQIERLEDQLTLLKSQVRQAQQLAALGTVAATIAHEVNNLLTPIQAYAQAALDNDDPELKKKALNVTISGVRMLVSMSERILKISAATRTKPQQSSILAVIDEATASLCRDLSRDGIEWGFQVDDALTAWVDPVQLQQVLFNLFLNARQAMSQEHGCQLKVSASSCRDRVVIEIFNTGKGIEPDVIDHVFELLQTTKQGTTMAGPHRCSGLGLALCRDLIEENSGSIRVESTVGCSTTFTIDLPACAPSNS